MADVNLTHTGAELDAAIAAVLADYADVSGVTAAAADVMTGKIFVDASGEEVAGTNDGSGDTSDATANAGRILAPYTAYVAAGKVTGVIPNNAGDVAAVSYHVDGTSLHVIPAEGYTDGIDDATVITDADFIEANIKSGVNLFGKDGSLTGAAANSIVITEVDANGYPTSIEIFGLTVIVSYMFYNLSISSGGWIKLDSVVLPDGVVSIGDSGFQNCAYLTSIMLPNGVTSVGNAAFHTCSLMAEAILSDSLLTIGSTTFLACTSLTNVSLGTHLQSIGQSAFKGCTALRKIWIPISCTTISTTSYTNGTFYQCSSSLVLYCEAESQPVGWTTWWNYYSSSGQLTVNWGVTKEAFDAL